ncbi:hypothetical protein A2853_00255 [Candidatus Kaiserbacteria bacterium RIFCSPHIGHO2_01_FULL_55_17]|uniref:Aspartate kinase n=1 Tax=Candidatus Kaiserbacteria bacterium RIFCSPHIGHO2_01_FULL_55_17 TaxID=1798484 RepID=A0A1F6DAI8_9BACT|nr:MAG: hypothetical protein A2853_00255 [Candidatus Kaiserbacteria bacterium RIFCSPHIGHO2_01_FULL_55_17]
MRTISQVVEEVIGQSPFLAEALAEGIANNAEIARKIKPEVEKRLLEEVSESSIAMALHRMGKARKAPQFGLTFLKHISDITVRSGLVELVFPNSFDLFPVLESLSPVTKGKKDTFVTFSHGVHESLFIINKDFADFILAAFPRGIKVQRTEGLSAITMHLPETSLNVSGLYYPILKALAFEGVSFVEIMSVDTEFSIIFRDEDIDRAFSVIKKITS